MIKAIASAAAAVAELIFGSPDSPGPPAEPRLPFGLRWPVARIAEGPDHDRTSAKEELP